MWYFYHFLLLESDPPCPPPPTNPVTFTFSWIGGPVVDDPCYLIGDQIKYVCFMGAIDGESISTLQADGTWTLNPLPMCKPGMLIETQNTKHIVCWRFMLDLIDIKNYEFCNRLLHKLLC